MAAGTTRMVATFVAETAPEDLPDAVIDEARRLFLESIAVSILGARSPLGQRIAEGLAIEPASYALPNPDEHRDSTARAAFFNAATADLTDSAGGSYKSVVHPGKNVLPATLTVGLAEGLPGRDLVLAAMCAVECSFRLDYVMGLEHNARGHYSDGTIGALGASLAVGKLRGFDAARLEAALGNAALLAPATVGGTNMLTAPGRPLAMGQAAATALRACTMAASGVAGPPDALECPGGFAGALAEVEDLSRVTKDLGQEWECLSYYLKPYVGCKLTHPAREGLRKLRAERDLRADDVERITVHHPFHDIPVVAHHAQPGGGIVEHSCSAPYLMANVLLHDDLGPGVLDEDRMEDPALHSLADRIEILEDEAMTAAYSPGLEARAEVGMPIRMEVRLRSGATLTCSTNKVSGDPFEGWEMTTSKLEQKFHTYVGDALPDHAKELIIDLVLRLDEVDDLDDLRTALSASASRGGS